MQRVRARGSSSIIIALALGLPGTLAGELPAGAPKGEDGRFENFAGAMDHGSLSVKAPFILRRFGTWFRSGEDAPQRVTNDGAYLRENARHSSPTVTWIGHSTLLVQMGHVTFLTDPTWSDSASPVPLIGPKRFVEPGIAMKDLPPIDFVVVSHNHYDHMDLPTLRALAQAGPETRFFVPLGNGELLREHDIQHVEELDWGQKAVHGGVNVYCLPAQHWSKRSLADDNRSLWSSWAIVAEDRRFYFAGDTGYFPGFRTIGERFGPFDLAAVPVGAYAPSAMMRESHMNPEEAVQAAIDLRATRAVAVHFGTFDLSDEPLAEPPQRFKESAGNGRLGDEAAWVLKIGETRTF